MQNFDVPAELSDLVMQLLEKEPAKRPLSALGVAETLQQIGRQRQGEVTTQAPRKKNNADPSSSDVAAAVASTPKRKDKKFPWLLIAGAIGAAALCLTMTLVIAGFALLK